MLILYSCSCGHGGIGRHARLRIWCRKTWGFKSLCPHHYISYSFGTFHLIIILKLLIGSDTEYKSYEGIQEGNIMLKYI